MDYKVKMKVQTSYYGKVLLPGDIVEIDHVTAKRWYANNIATLRKVDIPTVAGKMNLVKKVVDEFEDDEPEEIDEDFEKENVEEAETDGAVHNICDDDTASSVPGNSSGKPSNGRSKTTNKS